MKKGNEIPNLLQNLCWLFEYIIPQDSSVKWKMERLIVIFFSTLNYDSRSNSFMTCNSRRSLLLHSICLQLWYSFSHSLPLPLCPLPNDLVPLSGGRYFPAFLLRPVHMGTCDMLSKTFRNSSKPLAFALCHKNSVSQMRAISPHWAQEWRLTADPSSMEHSQ